MKTALVTGANRGIGAGFVDVLAAQGYKVYAGMRHAKGYVPASPNVEALELDVADDASIQRAAQKLGEDGATLDLLVNNAGLNKDTATDGHSEQASKLDSLDRAALLKMFDVNAIAPLMMAKYMTPLMTGERAFIVNVSSQRASFGDQNTSANYGYRASKVALNMFVACLPFDLPKNIQTFAVHPGSVLTDMNQKGTVKPADAAAQIIAITTSWDPAKNGAFLNTDGQYYPL